MGPQKCVQAALSFEVQSTWTVSVDWDRSKGRILKPSIIAVVLSVAATMMSMSSHADDPSEKEVDSRRIDSGLQAVSNDQPSGSRAMAGATLSMWQSQSSRDQP